MRKRKAKKRTRSLRAITLIYSRKMKVLLLNHRHYLLLRNRLPKHPHTHPIQGIPTGESGPGTRGMTGNGMVERPGTGKDWDWKDSWSKDSKGVVNLPKKVQTPHEELANIFAQLELKYSHEELLPKLQELVTVKWSEYSSRSHGLSFVKRVRA